MKACSQKIKVAAFISKNLKYKTILIRSNTTLEVENTYVFLENRFPAFHSKQKLVQGRVTLLNKVKETK
jgi:hypothetical protein